MTNLPTNHSDYEAIIAGAEYAKDINNMPTLRQAIRSLVNTINNMKVASAEAICLAANGDVNLISMNREGEWRVVWTYK